MCITVPPISPPPSSTSSVPKTSPSQMADLEAIRGFSRTPVGVQMGNSEKMLAKSYEVPFYCKSPFLIPQNRFCDITNYYVTSLLILLYLKIVSDIANSSLFSDITK